MIDLVGCIKAVAPYVDAKLWADAFTAPLQYTGVTTPRKVAMALGQFAYECSGFTELQENLFYSTSKAMMSAWPSRFPTVDSTLPYLRNPAKLANKVYADRMGNGPESSGDGWRYRGRTAVHITGKENYQKLATAFGRKLDDQFLDSLLLPTGAALAACWWWGERPKLLTLSEQWDIPGVTLIVNGGTNGLKERTTLCNLALKTLSGSAPVAAVTASREMTADELNDLQLKRIRT